MEQTKQKLEFLSLILAPKHSKYLLSLLLLIVGSAFMCAQTITGTVIDAESEEPIVGATVREKGNVSNGTITDLDGNFSMDLESGSNTLLVSYIGYAAQEIDASESDNVQVRLSASGVAVNEVVVTALGLTKEEEALGYAASTISAEQLTTTSTPSVASALYGKAPGVSVRSVPGGATSGINVNIRGFSSITGNTQPLYVVDGVPIRNGEFANTSYWSDQRIRGNGIVDINQDDIASMTVLKGASAAALYGSEAVNGVILIETKRGKKTKGLGIEVRTNYSTNEVAYLPEYQTVRGPGYPSWYFDLGQNEDGFVMRDSDGDGTPDARGLGATTLNFGPKFDGEPVLAWTGEMVPYVASDKGLGDFFNNADESSINVALSNAFDKGNYRFSFTRQDNNMLSYNAKNEKNIANLSSRFQLSDNLTTDLIIKYINQDTRNRPYKIDRMVNNFGGMANRFDRPDWYLDYAETSLGYRYATGTNASLTPDENLTIAGYSGDVLDYAWRLLNHNSYENSNRLMATLRQAWQIIPGLELAGRISTDYTAENNENSSATERPISLYTNPGGGYSIRNNDYTLFYGDVLASYMTDINEDIGIEATAGYTARREKTNWASRNTAGGLNPENKYDFSASINTTGNGSGRSSFVTDAFLGTLSFDFQEKVYLEGTIRRDRTSTMHPNTNSFVYPSVNSSIILNRIFSLPESIQLAKLRASYGIVGNYPEIYRANVAYNQSTLGVQTSGGTGILFNNIPGSFGNDLIRPEEKREFEVGFRVNYLNRFDLDFSYYNGQIVDQILPLTLPTSAGAGSILTNIGTLRNKGIEIQLGADIVRNSDFYWNSILNYAKNNNVVEKLANNSTELLHQDFDGNAAQIRSIVGQPMGDIYAHPIKTNEQGQQVVGPNGLYELDGNTWTKYGNAMPDFEGGFLNSLNYKGITLDAVIDFSYGGDIMPTGLYWMISRGLTEESLNYMDAASGGLSYYVDADGKGVQTNEAQGPNGELVRHDGMLMDGVVYDADTDTYSENTNVVSQILYYAATYNWGGPQYGNSQYFRYINENDWIKMRELTLGYNLPSKWANEIGMQSLNISAFGRNLFFLHRTIPHIDPEQTTSGSKWYQNINNAGNNPSFRTFGIQLKTSF